MPVSFSLTFLREMFTTALPDEDWLVRLRWVLVLCGSYRGRGWRGGPSFLPDPVTRTPQLFSLPPTHTHTNCVEITGMSARWRHNVRADLPFCDLINGSKEKADIPGKDHTYQPPPPGVSIVCVLHFVTVWSTPRISTIKENPRLLLLR